MRKRDPERELSPDQTTWEGSDPYTASEPDYRKMALRQARWAKTDSGWKSLVAVALIAGLCIGSLILNLVLQRGWDGMLAMLGY